MKQNKLRVQRRGLLTVAALALTLAIVLGLAADATSAQVRSEATPHPSSSVGPALAGVAADRPDIADGRVYMPLVSLDTPPPPLFADDFEGGVYNWTPYTNYEDLLPEQWYWDQDRVSGGSAVYTFAHWRGGLDPEDGLSMYLGEGSQDWTDYRASVRLNLRRGDRAGLWVRGTYRDQGSPGQWFKGYFCMVGIEEEDPEHDYVELLKVGAFGCPKHSLPNDDPCNYNFAEPHEIAARIVSKDLKNQWWYQLTVEARGPTIKCWLDDELAIDYTDRSAYLNGTIGLKTYGKRKNRAIVAFDDVLVEPLD